MFEDFKTKPSVIIVYTGGGKGKTSAAIGLTARSLGTGWRVAFIQFIKYWDVGEHAFFKQIKDVYGDKLFFYKGGKGFYNAGTLSAKGVSEQEHRTEAKKTLQEALKASRSGNFDLVVCDEISNAVNDGLLDKNALNKLMSNRHKKTSLCLTGRNFPNELLGKVDIATEMKKVRHHFDEKFIANKGIDY